MADDEISGLATSIRNKLGSLPAAFTSNRCIYKVPKHIRKVNEECYRPSVVSIGPIYYGDPSLQATEELKLSHLRCFLEHGDNSYTLEHCLNIVRNREGKIRDCYAEQITLCSNEFIEMVLIDAAFIIFLWHSYLFSLENHPYKNKLVEVFSQVERDLFLEENQLPFFILEDLYGLAFSMNTTYSRISFIHLTCSFVHNRFVRSEYTSTIMEGAYVKHLVDFLRIYFLLPSKLREKLPCPSSSTSREHPQFPLRVADLSAAGVKFVASEGTKVHLLDIEFTNGVLHVPKFILQDTTKSLFRSIIYSELCHNYFDSYFVDYMFFLCNLISSPEDVEILVKYGIIENWPGSDEEAANLFNNSTKHIPLHLNNFYYSKVVKDVNAYATTSWHRWKAILKKNYFNHPWAIISVIYAVVLLILTFLQTISGYISNR